MIVFLLPQSTFYDGLLVFDSYPFSWMVDKFFYETIGLTWSFLSSQISQRWSKGSMPPLEALERDIYKVRSPPRGIRLSVMTRFVVVTYPPYQRKLE